MIVPVGMNIECVVNDLKFIHIADVHLGRIPDAGQPWSSIRKKEIYETFCEIIEYANRHAVDFLFIAGDLFDHVPDEQELLWLDRELGRLEHTCVIYATGECDYLEKDAPIVTFQFTAPVYVIGNAGVEPNILPDSKFYGVRDENASMMYDCIHFSHFHLNVYGVSFFEKRNSLPVLDENVPFDRDGINLLVAHGGEKGYLPIDISLLKNRNYQYIALGHKHNYEEIINARIVYPGTPEPLAFGETGRHGFVEGVFTENGVDICLRKIAKREYKTIAYPVSDALTSAEIAEELGAMMNREGREHIYHIRLVRLEQCEKNFQIEEQLSDYWLEDIEGQQFKRKDYAAYMKVNHNNIFSKKLAQLYAPSPVRQDAAKLAVDMIIDISGLNHRWSKRLGDRSFEEYRKKAIIQLENRRERLRHSKELQEYEQARERLKVSPDVLEKLNAAWADERKTELAHRTTMSYLDQIGKKYKQRWMRTGMRTAVIPLFAFIIMCVFWFPYVLMRFPTEQMGAGWWLLPLTGALTVVLTYCLGYTTSKFIDTRLGRGNPKITMQQDVDQTKAKLKELEQQLSVLHERRREFQIMENQRKDILADIDKQERKAENIHYEVQLITEALDILCDEE